MPPRVSSTGASPPAVAAVEHRAQPLHELAELRRRHRELAVLRRPDQRIRRTRASHFGDKRHQRDVARRADCASLICRASRARTCADDRRNRRGSRRRRPPGCLPGWSAGRGSRPVRPAASAARAAPRRRSPARGSARPPASAARAAVRRAASGSPRRTAAPPCSARTISVRWVVSTLGGSTTVQPRNTGLLAQPRVDPERRQAEGGLDGALAGQVGDAALRVHRQQHGRRGFRRGRPRSP